ncbi:unnamed protein product [Clonostachys chloroleuca]|uniref:Uncharacterized protein n=1 Tax=Clonostachys chloroleuca TaxID=1926264 RepID=A0AA35Q3Y3_9HYPO|nr:unnamed protein product [Clonostachys chloroleuca]
MLPLGQESRSSPRPNTLGLGLAGYPATFDPDFLRRHYLGSLAEPPLSQDASSSSIMQQPSTLGGTVETPDIHRQDFCKAQRIANPNIGPDQTDLKAGTTKPRLARPVEQNSSRLSRTECLERARQLRTEVLEAYSQRTDDGTVSVQVESARWSLSICHMRCGEFAAARALMALVAQTRAERLGKSAKKTMDAERQLEYLDMLLTDSGMGGSGLYAG